MARYFFYSADLYTRDDTQLTGGFHGVMTIDDDAKTAEEHGPNFHMATADSPLRTTTGLRQRALPFLDMLRQAQRQDEDILWGL